MATALAIITDAYRESNIIPVGQVPTANHQAEAFTRLKALIASVYGNDLGAPLVDWPVGVAGYNESMAGWGSSNWAHPQPNVRLICNLESAQTVYLPFAPDDGARIEVVDRLGNFATYNLTLDGNGRNVEGAATAVLAADGYSEGFLYRADLGEWKLITTLPNTAAELPFPEAFDDYFVTMLAMRLNPRYGRSLSAETTAWLTEMRNMMSSRYRQTRKTIADPGVLVQNKARPGRPADPYNPGFGN